MQLTYDPRHNIAYFRLQEKNAEVETIRVSDALNVDIAPDGTVYGIELLNANEQLQVGDDGELIVINEALGQRRRSLSRRNRGGRRHPAPRHRPFHVGEVVGGAPRVQRAVSQLTDHS